MAYWLVKTEPEDYSWERFEQDGKTLWTGVRNFQARNHLREMQPEDWVFVYHTGEERNIVGMAKVSAAAVADPTAETGDWLAIELVAHVPLVRVVSLEEVRNTYGLSVMPLVTQARLSVQPVTEAQATMILKIAKTQL